MNWNHWRRGIRLYIAAAIGVVSLEVAWWASVSYSDSRVVWIRSEEVYGWLAIIFLALALTIGPLLKLFPNLPGALIIRDARRLIGIGAAWFATLHTLISYGYLFQFQDPLTLAGPYQVSFLMGIVGLMILLAMAVTSFDAAFRRMGTWWLRLHRLVYVAVITVLLHAFMVGSHAATPVPLIILTGVSTLLLSATIWTALRHHTPTFWQIITISYMVIFMLAVLNYGLTRYLGYNFPESLHHNQHEMHL